MLNESFLLSFKHFMCTENELQITFKGFFFAKT
jgi:hypothetical protein